ncbi:MAG: hypothetical protein CMJ25_25265 [Phycisphaerae bacterium]|nr:hypothetical protein [Phycisphaerae bacterium]|tara:strand:+ start:789 stop:1643 length:855 start_codon:yes stop_codon:yes gene_type:complete
MKTVEIPIEQCMFAELPEPTSRGRIRQQELMYAFEAQLPISIDQVQMAFAKLGHRIIGCACPKSQLQQHRAVCDAAVPTGLPDWIDTTANLEVHKQLNLLVGEMRPISQIRRSERTMKSTCFVLITAAALFYIGAMRRTHALNRESAQVQSRISEMYERVLPQAPSINAQPDSIRFATRMNQLKATRTGTENGSPQENIRELAWMLSDWPDASKAQVRSIVLDPTGLRIEASLPDNEHASTLIQHFGKATDWKLQSQQVSAQPDRVDLSMQLSHLVKEPDDATE